MAKPKRSPTVIETTPEQLVGDGAIMAALPAEAIPAAGLSLVSQLVAEMRALRLQIDEKAAEQKALQDAHDRIEQGRLPDALMELGFLELKLADGSTLSCKPEYHCSITGPKREAALEWLRAHDFGDIIKTELAIIFDKGQEQLAVDFYTDVVDRFPENKTTLVPGVHPSTLKALVKSQHESGEPMPEETFSIHIINRATIKAPK